MHLLFDSYERIEEIEDISSSELFSLCSELLYILCAYEPSYINIEDDHGISVLEYTIDKEVAYTLVRRL